MNEALSLPMTLDVPSMRWLGEGCGIQEDGNLRVLIVGGAPVLRFAADDSATMRLAAAMLMEAKVGKLPLVLAEFGLDDATLHRVRVRLRAGGVAAVVGPVVRSPYKLDTSTVERILDLTRLDVSRSTIAQRLGVGTTSVGAVLKANGVSRPSAKQQALVVVEAPTEIPVVVEAPMEIPVVEAPMETPVVVEAPMEIPCVVEAPVEIPDLVENAAPIGRASSQDLAGSYALMGLSPDGEAEVVFEARTAAPNAGALLAVPALARTGLLEAMREVYGQLAQGIYGLRATVMVLALMALLRRPRPEALKERDPAALGDILGLARAPEVKTLRRKLSEVAQHHKAHELWQALARRWLAERRDLLGILYADGHVRCYHGKHKLPKAHVTQRNQSLPATTDTWVNDVDGQPVFVVTSSANEGLTQLLLAIIDEATLLGGSKKGTVVFDRGGWSPALFVEIIARGWHLLTYRKGEREDHPIMSFTNRTERIDGRDVTYTISERIVSVGNAKLGLELREIAIARADGKQTHILTSHRDAAAVLLAYRMFQRWRLENYFKYMLENFDLDGLVDYDVEADDPTRDVPNPERKRVARLLAAARVEMTDVQRRYGDAASANQEAQRPTMRGFKIANADLGRELAATSAEVERLEAEQKAIPARVPVAQAVGGADKVVKLSPERKLFADAIKAAAYRAETMLVGLLRPHFKRHEDEARAFLRTVMQLPGDIEVHGDDVVVRLAPMSAPRFTASLRALCNDLNRLNPIYPETSYRMRYEVALPNGELDGRECTPGDLN